jgi:hypothetical protein
VIIEQDGFTGSLVCGSIVCTLTKYFSNMECIEPTSMDFNHRESGFKKLKLVKNDSKPVEPKNWEQFRECELKNYSGGLDDFLLFQSDVVVWRFAHGPSNFAIEQVEQNNNRISINAA